MTNSTYLGTAMRKPVALINGAGMVVSGSIVIEQSIIDILSTPKNSRFFLREYGSRLHELLYEPNDDILHSMMRLFIFEAIRDWEGRAKFINVEFDTDGAKTDCQIWYRELSSNEIKSFIYPFYRELIH